MGISLQYVRGRVVCGWLAGDSAATWCAVRDMLRRNSRPVYSDGQCHNAVACRRFQSVLRRQVAS